MKSLVDPIKNLVMPLPVLVLLSGVVPTDVKGVFSVDRSKNQANQARTPSEADAGIQSGSFPGNVVVPAVSELPPHVDTFFSNCCTECHGPERSKGNVTFHDIGNPADWRDPDLWPEIQDVLEAGEMPPEEERQPDEAEREAMWDCIASGMRAANAASAADKPAVCTRRLTNFEYQNTMRDLLGFELNLRVDPVKPYHFNNTAEFMLLVPKQVQAYLNCARRAMAGAIVDPGESKEHRHQWSFEPREPAFTSSPADEVGMYGDLPAAGRDRIHRRRMTPDAPARPVT